MIERKLIKANAREQLKNNFAIIAIVILIAELIANMSLVNDVLYYSGINLPSLAVNSINILGFLLSGVMLFGVARIALKVIDNTKFHFGELFIGLRIYLKLLGLYAVTTLLVALGTMAFVIPGVFIWLNFSQAYYILSEDEDKSILQCLIESTKMMQGHKMELLYLELSFIGWILLCILTMGLALLWVEPYMQLSLANFHTALKELNSEQAENEGSLY